MLALVDSSALIAAVDTASRDHTSVLHAMRGGGDILLLPVTVLVEADYLILSRFGVRAELAYLRAVVSGELRLEGMTVADLTRSLELIEEYADSQIGVADASIVAIAERLRVSRILTLDQHHFRMFRPRHCEAFELLP